MKAKKNFLLIIFIFSLTSLKSYSQERGLGLGVMIGEPTGFSGKYWLNKEHALDFGLAYSFVHSNSAFSLHGDYLIHLPDLIKSEYRLPVYYGFGARIHTSKNGNALGARGVVGIVWMYNYLPIDAFIELAPVFNLFPETSLQLDFAIGGRYYL